MLAAAACFTLQMLMDIRCRDRCEITDHILRAHWDSKLKSCFCEKPPSTAIKINPVLDSGDNPYTESKKDPYVPIDSREQ